MELGPGSGGQDPAGMLFVVVDDEEREFPWRGCFLREVSLPSLELLAE